MNMGTSTSRSALHVSAVWHEECGLIAPSSHVVMWGGQGARTHGEGHLVDRRLDAILLGLRRGTRKQKSARE